MVYISSLALMGSMRQSTLSTQSQLATVQTELSSGTYADVGLGLGAASGTLLSMSQQQDRLSAYTSANALAATRLSATTSALSSLQTTAQSFLGSLTTAVSTGTPTSVLQSNAGANLNALIAGLNTSVAGESIFGGVNTGVTPIAAYTDTSASKQAVDSAFTTAFGTSPTSADASTITAQQMTDYLNGPFADMFSASSYSTTWSTASDETINSQISTNQSIPTSVSANSSALRGLAQAYAMINQFAGSSLSQSAQQAVVSSAMSLINTSLNGLTDMQTQIGAAQNAITTANDQITSQATVLTTASSGLQEVDPYQLNIKLGSLQTQLQASYEMTSSLQKLSFVNYFTP